MVKASRISGRSEHGTRLDRDGRLCRTAACHPSLAGGTGQKNKFMHWLRSNGFMVVTKDGAPAEEGRYKANVDVMMAIDALELSVEMRPDVVILVTGDADFAYLVIKLRRRGIRVEVASVAANLGNLLKSGGE
jgi:uncharacterized LabA/DUF88 family protein